MSRNAQKTAAGAVLLALSTSLFSGCGERDRGLGVSGGVVWTRVTPVEAREADRPDWLADSIAFQVRVQGQDLTAIAREDGTGLLILPQAGSAGSRAPRWVRSGLLIESSDLGGAEDLWYRDLATGVTRRLEAFPGMEWTPAPRPGSPGIVYVEGIDPDSGRLILVPDTASAPLGRIPLTPSSIAAGEPDWNPAGDAICFSAAGPGGSRQIWKLSLTDTLAIQLTAPSDPTVDRSPRWSPDGARILMVSNRGGRWGVWTVSPMGEAVDLRILALDSKDAVLRHAIWSPNGTEILLSSDRGGDRALWRLSNLGP